MENITVGKSRKSGKWEILVQPGEPYDKHLEAYRKIAVSAPINDEYERVIIGRIQPTSPLQTLLTAEQYKQRNATNAASLNRVQDAVEDANRRQLLRDTEMREVNDKRHSTALAEKNKIVEEVRKESKQTNSVIQKPKPEPVAA